MIKNRIIFLIIIIFSLIFIKDLTAQQKVQNMAFGAELGFMSGTINGTVFTLGFNGDYLLADNFSLGEFITFTPSGDLFQINANTVARFVIPSDMVNFIPYMGLGFVYGSISNDAADENAFSIGFPIGVQVTYPVADQIEVSGRAQIEIYNLDYGEFGKDNTGLEFMFGFRFSP